MIALDFGRNNKQLCDGIRKNSHTPIKIMDDVIYVSTGNKHIAVIKNEVQINIGY